MDLLDTVLIQCMSIIFSVYDLLFGAIVDGGDVCVEKAVVFWVLGGHIL